MDSFHKVGTILPCPTSSYKDGCCWQCPKGHQKSLKVDSVLENSNISYKEFISLLSSFAEGLTVSRAAERASVGETTTRRIFGILREQMAEDIRTSPKIGGPSTIVELLKRQSLARESTTEGDWWTELG